MGMRFDCLLKSGTTGSSVWKTKFWLGKLGQTLCTFLIYRILSLVQCHRDVFVKFKIEVRTCISAI